MQRRLILATLLLAPSLALAHEPRVGPHGGTLVDAGPYHVEVLMKGTTVDVYVSDVADKPLPASGFKGTAILVIDGKSQRVALAAASANRLTGQSGIAATGPLKGAVLLVAPDGKSAQAKLN